MKKSNSVQIPLLRRRKGFYSSQKKELQTLLQTYYQTYGIPCWKYPYRMNNADFADGGHLNYKGAKKYQKWLASQFKLLK
jgi:hypothetical protein